MGEGVPEIPEGAGGWQILAIGLLWLILQGWKIWLQGRPEKGSDVTDKIDRVMSRVNVQLDAIEDYARDGRDSGARLEESHSRDNSPFSSKPILDKLGLLSTELSNLRDELHTFTTRHTN